MRFNFSDREHTFSLTVSLLGGGGFFAIGISSQASTRSRRRWSSAPPIAIDLGVASGGVEIKAGVYFHWLEPQPDKGSIDLAGLRPPARRAVGPRADLGLADLQPAAHLSQGQLQDRRLGRSHAGHRSRGAALQREVSVRCRKEFGGSENADPKFIDLVPDQATWDEYCAAFAAGGCLMARQSLMWTALPNGYSADGTSLRLSVLLSPRLEPQAQPNALSSFFPDWEDWPATLSTATFTIAMSSGGSVSIPLTQTTGPNRVDITTYGAPESAIWKALCSGSLFVRPYEYKDLSSNPVLSFDTLALAGTIRGLYRRLAASATGDMPKVSDIVDDARWDRLAKTVAAIDREGSHEGTGLRRPDHQFERFQKTGLASEDKLVETLARFQLFHTSPLKPVTVTKARAEDDPNHAQPGWSTSASRCPRRRNW